MSHLPLQPLCDPDNPEEFAIWAFVELSWNQSTPYILPPMVFSKMSQRLWDAGFRHHPELQTIKYVPPTEAPTSYYDGLIGGKWKGIDEEGETVQPTASVYHGMSHREKAEMAAHLIADNYVQPQPTEPETPAPGEVAEEVDEL